MKPGIPAWSVVVVVPKGPRHFLAISRHFSPRDPSFPGGDSEPTDATPADTARREVFEETGVRVLELRCMDQWTGERGQPVYAFFAPRFQAPRRLIVVSPEGKPYWASAERLLEPSAEFATHTRRLLEKLKRV